MALHGFVKLIEIIKNDYCGEYMNLNGLDLNLLVALNVLLETQSVTEASRRMALSQPAMSSALGRLRRHFGNDLLVVDGKKMIPTSYALDLAPRLRECLAQLEAFATAPPVFDPTSTQRVFKLAASDYVSTVIFVPLVEKLANINPKIQLEIIDPSDNSSSLLENTRIDLLIGVSEILLSDHPAEALFEDQHVVVGWEKNPIFQQEITADILLEAGHVGVVLGKNQIESFADRHFSLISDRRKVEVWIQTFTMVPRLLCGTNRLALMHKRLAHDLGTFFPMKMAPLPFEIPPVRMMAQYHRARASDEGLNWLLAQMREVVREGVGSTK